MRFRKLIAPVIIAVTTSTIALIALVVVAARLQDEAALEGEKTSVSQDIAAKHTALAILAEDNAWWDEAVQKILIENDVVWIDKTYGETVVGMRSVQGVLVIRADGTPLYSRFVDALPGADAFLNAGLAKAAGELTPQPDFQPHNGSGLLVVSGELIAYGASVLQSETADSFDADTIAEARPTVVFISWLNGDFFAKTGTANAIEALRLEKRKPASGARLELKDDQAQTIGFVAWRSAAPGSEMITNMVLPAFFLLAVIFGALAIFIRRAVKLVSEVEAANKAKSSFLASTSHEIRTPLNAILGFAELMSLELYGKVEGVKNKEYLGLIRQSGEHLLAIINDILDISKLEAGRFKVYAEKVDSVHVLASSRDIMSPAATEGEVALVVDSEPADVYSDERLMRQVLINLMSNGIKFTEPGGKVMVQGRKRESRYVITVSDTGSGMTRDELKAALSLFGQADRDQAIARQGSGLGLPLVSRFMDLLRGSFSISSTPGEGTIVTVAFPLYDPDRR